MGPDYLVLTRNMPKILEKERLNEVIYRIDVEAPLVARKGKAGQFVMLIIDEHGERFPLTLADSDKERGSITLVFQVTGKSTLHLSTLEPGDEIAHLAGPLGKPAEIGQFGTVVVVGGGCGVATAYPQARAFKEAGNHVIGIMGFRSKDYVFWRDRLPDACDRLVLCTDDGSEGFKGFTTDALKELIDSGTRIDRVVSIGPLIMMANTVKVTRPHGIPTIVSLNAIMVDGTGMCGCCRVSTPDGTRFSCVDGPDMDGFSIDFEELMRRNRQYKLEERHSLELFKKTCNCAGTPATTGGPSGSVEKCE